MQPASPHFPSYMHGDQHQQYGQYPPNGHNGLGAGGHPSVPLPRMITYVVAGTAHKFQDMSPHGNPLPVRYPVAVGQETIPPGVWAPGTPQQPPPMHQWAAPDFNFNNSPVDVLPASTSRLGTCCSQAPGLERSSEESNPYSFETTIATPVAPQKILPPGVWAPGMTQQPPPMRPWAAPGLGLNSLPSGVLPTSAPRPGNCCSQAPGAERSSEKSNPYSFETTVATPASPEQFVADTRRSDLTASQQDGGNGEEGELATEGFLQTTMNSAPQTTMYQFPASYATHGNPISHDQYNQLRASESWRSQQMPQWAASGIAGSTATRADDSVQHQEYCFSCPCGENCICPECPAHPFNPTQIQRVHGVYPFLPLTNDAATVLGEHDGSWSNHWERPEMSAMNQFYVDADELNPGESSTPYWLSSENFTYFEYAIPTLAFEWGFPMGVRMERSRFANAFGVGQLWRTAATGEWSSKRSVTQKDIIVQGREGGLKNKMYAGMGGNIGNGFGVTATWESSSAMHWRNWLGG
ncbi:MAG: hypothetical protein Q9226_002962 [Calogaya cf. arnoldii]